MRRQQRERIKEITKSFIVLFILGFILYKFQIYIERRYGIFDNYEVEYVKKYRNNVLNFEKNYL
jgi:hypothetical protein